MKAQGSLQQQFYMGKSKNWTGLDIGQYQIEKHFYRESDRPQFNTLSIEMAHFIFERGQPQ